MVLSIQYKTFDPPVIFQLVTRPIFVCRMGLGMKLVESMREIYTPTNNRPSGDKHLWRPNLALLCVCK